MEKVVGRQDFTTAEGQPVPWGGPVGGVACQVQPWEKTGWGGERLPAQVTAAGCVSSLMPLCHAAPMLCHGRVARRI